MYSDNRDYDEEVIWGFLSDHKCNNRRELDLLAAISPLFIKFCAFFVSCSNRFKKKRYKNRAKISADRQSFKRLQLVEVDGIEPSRISDYVNNTADDT